MPTHDYVIKWAFGKHPQLSMWFMEHPFVNPCPPMHVLGRNMACEPTQLVPKTFQFSVAQNPLHMHIERMNPFEKKSLGISWGPIYAPWIPLGKIHRTL